MSACESCGDKTYRELLDDNVRVRAERHEARADVTRLQGLLVELRTERDEARAEVEQLRAWQREVADGTGYINYAEGQGGYEVAPAETIVAAWKQREREADARADVFKRGAEAMREEAACDVERKPSRDRWDCAERIRALPIPEDKP